MLGNLDARAWLRAVVYNGATVRFDGWSDRSGKLRAYTNCCNREHHACRRYSFVDRYEDPMETVAYLFGWAELGGDRSREQHQDRSCEASGARRAEIYAEIGRQ